MSSEPPPELSRRQFISTSAKVVAGAAVAGAVTSVLAEEKKQGPKDKTPATKPYAGPDVLQPRKMGRVGFVVPAGGYGAMLTRAPQLAAAVFDKGFYFVHSSPGYTGNKSYQAVREMLKDKKRREKIILALKINPDRLDRDMKYFGLDHIDMIVPPKHSVKALSDQRYISAAVKARKAGKVRAIGWSCHSDTVGTLNFAAKEGVFDVALIGYGNAHSKEFAAAMKAAKAKGLGVFAMKHGGRPGVKNHAERLKWLLTKGQADSVLLSFSQVSQIDPVLKLKLGRLTAVQAAMLRLDDVRRYETTCCWCGECTVTADGRCANGVAIPQIMRYDYYLTERGWPDRARGKYARLAGCDTGACIDCGECEKACPRNLPVRRMLKEAHRRLA